MAIQYRLRQFRQALTLKIDPTALHQAQGILNPKQWALFIQLQPGEQKHALAMLSRLEQRGDIHSDLLVAALLHDIGKLRYRMNPIERVLVVLIRAISPVQARELSDIPHSGWEGMPGWRKALIIAEHHPAWGARLARDAGVSPLAEGLIRRHHQHDGNMHDNLEDILLHKLWVVDNES